MSSTSPTNGRSRPLAPRNSGRRNGKTDSEYELHCRTWLTCLLWVIVTEESARDHGLQPITCTTNTFPAAAQIPVAAPANPRQSASDPLLRRWHRARTDSPADPTCAPV